MSPTRLRTAAALLVGLVALALASPAAASPTDGHRLVGLLDYIGADYAEAVANGRVADAFEYEEMQALSAEAAVLLAEQDAPPPGATAAVARLRELIEQKAPVARVRQAVQEARRDVVAHFDVALAPSTPPDRARGAALYATHCASCHGERGTADVAGLEAMKPPPVDFTEPQRRQAMSPYRAYNMATFGIEGTAMGPFDELTEAQRWDVAFFAMALGHGGKPVEAALPAGFEPTLELLATATDAELARRLEAAGAAPDEVGAMVDDLRTAEVYALAAQPASADAGFETIYAHLDAAEQAWQAGEPAAARRQALTAYLEGFEPLESRLSAVDGSLVKRTEREFLDLRTAIEQGEGVEPALADLRQAVSEAEAVLQSEGAAGFGTLAVASAVIILREGIEVVLLVGLLLGMLLRLGRPEARRWVHAGWVAALIAGGATWFVASSLIDISGASREVLEGVVGLLAAAVLFSVSYWFLSQMHGERWMRFIKGKLAEHISGGRLFAIFGLSFLAVYREAFETVLFYQALLLEADGHTAGVWAGMGAGGAVLAVLAFLILRAGARLPLKPFFAVSGLLLYALCVVLVGSGLHSLVEAGVLPVVAVDVPELPWVGLYGEAIPLAGQLVLLTAAAIWALFTWRRDAPQAV